DGVNWEDVAGAAGVQASTFCEGEEILAASGSSVWFSSDSVNWRAANPVSPYRINGMAYVRGAYYAACDGGVILQSVNMNCLEHPRWSPSRGFEANYSG